MRRDIEDVKCINRKLTTKNKLIPFVPLSLSPSAHGAVDLIKKGFFGMMNYECGMMNRIDDFSEENKTKLALALKSYWEKHGKWEMYKKPMVKGTESSKNIEGINIRNYCFALARIRSFHEGF